MDGSTIEKAGAGPLTAILAEMATLWPVDTNSAATLSPADYDSLAKTLVYLEDLNVHPFYSMLIQPDLTRPEVGAISINKPEELSYKDLKVYGDSAKLNDFAAAVAKVFASGVVPVNLTQAQAVEVSKGVVSLELAMLASFPQGGGTPVTNGTQAELLASAGYVHYPVADVGKMAPALSLDKVIAALAPADFKPTHAVVASPAYLANVSAILSSTPRAIVQSYLAWRTITTLDKYVAAPELEPWTGKSKAEPTWKTCVAYVDKTMKHSLGRFYISSNFNEASRALGGDMLTAIRQYFATRIDALTWMSPEVKEKAKLKVKNIRQYIGYPESSPKMTDPASVAAYYAGLTVTPGKWFDNTVSARRWERKQKWSTLAKTDPGAFEYSVTQTNAYYLKPGNTITILAGIMQLPVFSPDLPLYASYGGLGSVLGHELVHGFDDSGRLFDPAGTLTPWWDETTTRAFEDKAKCFVEQYDAFRIANPAGEPVQISGLQTLGENLADAGGINAAFATWKAAAAGKAEQTLPGLEGLTPEQLFFISFAGNWCSTTKPADLDLTDEHAPGQLRILGATANSAAFREAFGCKVKEPTCEVW
jgi:endothelin-converting enzyme